MKKEEGRLKAHLRSYFGFWLCTVAVASNGFFAYFGHRYPWTWPVFGALTTIYIITCYLALKTRHYNARIRVLKRELIEMGARTTGRHREGDDE